MEKKYAKNHQETVKFINQSSIYMNVLILVNKLLKTNYVKKNVHKRTNT